jgi:hypothetical protein
MPPRWTRASAAVALVMTMLSGWSCGAAVGQRAGTAVINSPSDLVAALQNNSITTMLLNASHTR